MLISVLDEDCLQKNIRWGLALLLFNLSLLHRIMAPGAYCHDLSGICLRGHLDMQEQKLKILENFFRNILVPAIEDWNYLLTKPLGVDAIGYPRICRIYRTCCDMALLEIRRLILLAEKIKKNVEKNEIPFNLYDRFNACLEHFVLRLHSTLSQMKYFFTNDLVGKAALGEVDLDELSMLSCVILPVNASRPNVFKKLAILTKILIKIVLEEDGDKLTILSKFILCPRVEILTMFHMRINLCGISKQMISTDAWKMLRGILGPNNDLIMLLNTVLDIQQCELLKIQKNIAASQQELVCKKEGYPSQIRYFCGDLYGLIKTLAQLNHGRKSESEGDISSEQASLASIVASDEERSVEDVAGLLAKTSLAKWPEPGDEDLYTEDNPKAISKIMMPIGNTSKPSKPILPRSLSTLDFDGDAFYA